MASSDNQYTPAPVIKNGWIRAIIFLLTYLLVYGLFQFVGVILAAGITGYNMVEVTQLLQQTGAEGTSPGLNISLPMQIMGLFASILVVWLFRRLVDRKSIESLGLAWDGYQGDALYGFLWGIGLIGAGFVGLWATGYLSITAVSVNPGMILLYLFFFILVAISEELVFRGYILNNLMDSMPYYHALGISAVIFAIMHGVNPNVTITGMINIFLAGMLFGIYYIHRGNLYFPIMLHLSWNFFQGPIFGFEVSGMATQETIQQNVTGPEWITGGSFGFEGSAVLTVLLIATITFIHFQYRKKSLIG